MAQSQGNAKNILVGASPLFLTVEDSTVDGYLSNLEPGVAKSFVANKNRLVPEYDSATSYIPTLYSKYNILDNKFNSHIKWKIQDAKWNSYHYIPY